MRYQCQDCRFTDTAERFDGLSERGIFERIAPGEPFTDKECPRCGALAHPIGLDTYTLEPGRVILRNGAPFVSVAGCSRDAPGYAPADFDAFARALPALINFARSAITSPGSVALSRERIPTPTRARLNCISADARDVLKLLPGGLECNLNEEDR